MKCESCGAELTFFASLRQAMPHRFRCPGCSARYRIRAPRLNLFLLGIVAAFTALLYQFADGLAAHGPLYVFPYTLVTVGMWLAFEYLLHRHITRNGELVRLNHGGEAAPGSVGREAEADPAVESKEDA